MFTFRYHGGMGLLQSSGTVNVCPSLSNCVLSKATEIGCPLIYSGMHDAKNTNFKYVNKIWVTIISDIGKSL